jgi:hypothetical protein
MRNATTASFVGHLFRHDHLPAEVLEITRAWNAHRNCPPLPDTEIRDIVASIARRDLVRRRESEKG